MGIALVWFRRDLRLRDNPALQAALEAGHALVPVYVHAPDEEGAWRPGAASRAWLHRSLDALDADLRRRGSRLIRLRGPSLAALSGLARGVGAQAVFWNRCYEPAAIARDTALKQALRRQGLEVRSFNASLLLEPWSIANGQGGPYKVFTPYWRAAQTHLSLPPLVDAPAMLPAVAEALASESLADWRLLPAPSWDRAFWDVWAPGEAGADEALDVFVDGALQGYGVQRDRPDRVGTSRLSPHLHFGEIAPWRIVRRLQAARRAANAADIDGYVRELGWREFAHHLLYHFPQMPECNLDARFDRFEWAAPDPAKLQAWQQGRTGVPIVDAGMRELWATGWMHNRVRMIVASYLCKHLRMHWHEGARWFWDTLVDADLANNTAGWQWVAGTGADAAPYFRVFNPVLQAQKFDPDGAYVSRWIPGLSHLPAKMRHVPWQFPREAAACLPDYPMQPLVDLAKGREAALAAYARLREAAR